MCWYLDLGFVITLFYAFDSLLLLYGVSRYYFAYCFFCVFFNWIVFRNVGFAFVLAGFGYLLDCSCYLREFLLLCFAL